MSTKRDRYAGQGSIHGVVVVDKPTGPTSHDLVAAARRHFGTRRVGHAGTLDPMATGVLVLLLGEATKLSSHLTRDVKTYEAVVAFGSSTTTLDAQGTVTRRRALTAGWLSEETLAKALQAELERELQIPPAVSAIKVGGTAAHARVRRGEDVELAPRDVRLHELRLLRWDDQQLTVELTVSKGYYVRAFARDLGDALGVPAHLAALRRTRSSPFTLAQAVPFPLEGTVHPLSLLDVARQAFPLAHLTRDGVERARSGKRLREHDDYQPAATALPTRQPPEATSPPTNVDELGLTSLGNVTPDAPSLVACAFENRLIALAEEAAPGTLKIVRGIHDPTGPDLHAPGAVG